MESENSVNHPEHYNQSNMECIDIIQNSMSPEMFQGFLVGNVQKYISRYRYKNGVEDLRKANWYLNKLIEVSQ